MLLGIALIAGAVGLMIMNQQEDMQAQVQSQQMLELIHQEIEEVRKNQENAPSEPDPLENTPVELLTEADLAMTEKVIKGHAYIGYLSMPDLQMQLPVMAHYTNQKLQIAPCKYSGSLRGKDLVIMAHSFKDSLDAYAVEEMVAGEYDLTLFTCTKDRQHRLTIRCNLIEK